MFTVALLSLATLAISSPAGAHSELESSRPAAGTTVRRAPDHLVLRFSETPAEDSVVTVADRCTNDLVGDSFVAGQSFHVQLDGGTGGKYRVTYALVSAEDGHATRGNFGFTVRGPADCFPEDADEPDADAGDAAKDGDAAAAPDTDPASDDDGSSPVVPIVLGGLGLVVLAGLARFATRK
ncbi:MAG: copper resistance CopC family protein [Actinomycetota bacterium]